MCEMFLQGLLLWTVAWFFTVLQGHIFFREEISAVILTGVFTCPLPLLGLKLQIRKYSQSQAREIKNVIEYVDFHLLFTVSHADLC
jgi:hypothetical protein